MPEPTSEPLAVTAVVLAGGEGRRLAGEGKPGVTVGGRSLLDRVVSACPADAAVVVVGPRRPTERPVRWTREDPPGGGPLAGLAAGLARVDTPLLLLLATDLPRVGPVVPPLIAAARSALVAGREGAWVADSFGRHQPLVSCLSTASLRAAMPGDPRGLALRRVLDALVLDVLPAPPGSVDDVDTAEDLERVRQDVRRRAPGRDEEPSMTDEWLAAAAATLGIDPQVLDVDAVLDLARDVAHHVERKSAPLTAYLVGYAAASAAGSGEGSDGAALARRVGELALEWDQA